MQICRHLLFSFHTSGHAEAICIALCCVHEISIAITLFSNEQCNHAPFFGLQRQIYILWTKRGVQTLLCLSSSMGLYLLLYQQSLIHHTKRVPPTNAATWQLLLKKRALIRSRTVPEKVMGYRTHGQSLLPFPLLCDLTLCWSVALSLSGCQ